MKKTAKAFVIVGIVFGGIQCAAGIGNINIFQILWGIASILVGSFALSKLSKATQRAGLTGIGVCTLIFCNLVAGILILCLKDYHFNNQHTNNEPIDTDKTFVDVNNENLETNSLNKSTVEKLHQLKELKDNGTITEEEFNKMKADLLKEL